MEREFAASYRVLQQWGLDQLTSGQRSRVTAQMQLGSALRRHLETVSAMRAPMRAKESQLRRLRLEMERRG